MAVATTTAPAVTEDKELLISGSEAVAEALILADIDVVTAYPIRPYDTVMQAIAKKIANGQLVAEYIVAEGEHSQFEIVKHASTVGARVFCGSSGRGLGLRHGVPGGDAAPARAHGGPGGQPGARRPRGVRRRAQRRPVRARPRLDAGVDRHLAGSARHHPDRLSGGRGSPRVPAPGHLGRRRLPDPLAGHHPRCRPRRRSTSSCRATTAAICCCIPTTRSRWPRRPTRTGSSRSGARTTRP